jgi:hypothetical protein
MIYKIIVALFALSSLAGFTHYTKAQLYDNGIPTLTAKNGQSGEYMHGYRAGVVKGSQDVDAFNQDKINGVDGNHPPPCPLVGTQFKDYCSRWNQGYSDIVVDELD